MDVLGCVAPGTSAGAWSRGLTCPRFSALASPGGAGSTWAIHLGMDTSGNPGDRWAGIDPAVCGKLVTQLGLCPHVSYFEGLCPTRRSDVLPVMGLGSELPALTSSADQALGCEEEKPVLTLLALWSRWLLNSHSKEQVAITGRQELSYQTRRSWGTCAGA